MFMRILSVVQWLYSQAYRFMPLEWEQDISMFDWFFTPNNTSSKVIAITIGTIKYCYNNMFIDNLRLLVYYHWGSNRTKAINLFTQHQLNVSNKLKPLELNGVLYRFYRPTWKTIL